MNRKYAEITAVIRLDYEDEIGYAHGIVEISDRLKEYSALISFNVERKEDSGR